MRIEIIQSIEDALNLQGCITYKISGKSMEPMLLPNRDLVTIIKRTDNIELSENDVVLYREKGNFVLHRIVEIRKDGELVILGDNCSKKEYGIYKEQVLGVLKSFKHNGVHYEVTDDKYVEYIRQLRETEFKRTTRKLIYDILVIHLHFLPTNIYFTLKKLLKHYLVFQLRFV